MSYTITDVVKLIDAGFKVEEIKALDTDGLFTYYKKDPEPKLADPEPKPADPEPKPADPEPKPADPEPKPADPDKSITELKDIINDGFNSIITAFQASAVGGSQQKTPEVKTSEDILAEIISPYSKGGK